MKPLPNQGIWIRIRALFYPLRDISAILTLTSGMSPTISEYSKALSSAIKSNRVLVLLKRINAKSKHFKSSRRHMPKVIKQTVVAYAI